MKSRLLAGMITLLATIASADQTLTVLAAASMTDVLQDIKQLYEKTSPVSVRLSLASSGTLARQIDAGAEADVYISANRKWIDFLDKHNRLKEETITELLGNQLVLIVPNDHPFDFTFTNGIPLADAFSGWLAIGDYKSVPVGMYAKEALEHFGWFTSLKSRFVLGDNTRRVLLYVERGEADAGIVYSTDAATSDSVATIAAFPESSHRPIRYYAAVCTDTMQSTRADDFTAFLRSPPALAIFREAGFTIPKNQPPMTND